MNETIIKTHVKENIDLLKARDVYFDQARKRNKWYDLSIVIPPLVAGLTYLPFLVKVFPVIDSLRDYIIGITTILFVFISEGLARKNEKTLELSNALREEYDIYVFGLERNHFLFDQSLLKTSDGQWKEEIRRAWESRPDASKYELWYTEFAGTSKNANILCNQMDNIIYTYHVYNAYRKKLRLNVIGGITGILVLFLFSVFVWKHLSVFILMMFSLFEAFETQIDQYKTIKELISVNDYIYKKIRDDSEEIKAILADDIKGKAFLRSLQDVIVNNRNKSLFIPRSIRLKYLKNGNPFYKQLDGIKQIYMENPYIPDKAQDIDVLASSGEKVTATIKDVHDHLRIMLKDVNEVLKAEGIPFLLDGGSLIGACRDKGFVFWDDDIDLAIMYSDLEKAKGLLKEKLGNKYDIQDYDNDEFYSPRLSNFRIREKNSESILVEKDSELNEKYNFRGLFIDVYAYTPIVINRRIDSLVRKFMIQGLRIKLGGKVFFKGLYDKIRKEEAAWKYDLPAREKHEKKFFKFKAKYLKRVKTYLQWAHNTDYCAYVPNYIDNLQKPGPYIKSEYLFAKDKTAEKVNFEGSEVLIPKDWDKVLTAYYGNWRESPFKSLEELKNSEGKYEFSRKIFEVTLLKHFKYIDKLEPLK